MADIYGMGTRAILPRPGVFGVTGLPSEVGFCHKHLHQGVKGTGQECVNIC